jgi:hypothetical protein
MPGTTGQKFRANCFAGLEQLLVDLTVSESGCAEKRLISTHIPIAEVVNKMAISGQACRDLSVCCIQIRTVFMGIEIGYMKYAHERLFLSVLVLRLSCDDDNPLKEISHWFVNPA